MAGLSLIEPATDYPVSLAEVRTICRLTGTARDTELEIYRKGAVRQVERYLGRSLAEQTWQLDLDEFADEIALPNGPVTGIVTFTYRDADGVEQTVDPDLYMLDAVSDPPRILLNSGASWPTIEDRPANAVTVTYTAGYTPAALLDDVRLRLLQMCRAMFDGEGMAAETEIMEQLFPHRRIVI